jgi:hypothetical protein
MADPRSRDNYQPLALIAVILCALILFSLFFLTFLVAPLAILTLFYVGFAASDRAKRAHPPTAATEETPPVEERFSREEVTARLQQPPPR